MDEEPTRNNSKTTSWWQFRTQMEKKLLMTIILLSLALLVISAFILHQQNSNEEICMSETCVQTSAKLLAALDRTFDPCEDFQRFACGEYLDAMRYQRNATGELILTEISAHRRFEHVFDQQRDPTNTSPSIGLQNLRYFFNTCMNRSAIDEGVHYLKRKLIAEMGWPLVSPHWDDPTFNWTNAIMKLNQLGFKYEIFFDLRIHENFTEGRNYLQVIPPTLSSDSLGPDFRKRNEEFLMQTVEFFGGERHKAMYDVNYLGDFTMELIKVIAKHQPNERSKREQEMLELISLGNVENVSQVAPWRQLLSNITNRQLTTNDLVVFNVTNYMRDLHELLKKTPRRIQVNYIIWEVLKDMQLWYNLPNAPRRTMSERRHLCIEEVNKILPLVANQELATRESTSTRRKAVQDMVILLKEELFKTINNLQYQWISKPMKLFLLEKLQRTKFFIGGTLENNTTFQIIYGHEEIFTNHNFIESICKAKLLSDGYHFNVVFNQTTEETTLLRLMSLDAMANAYYLTNNYIGIPTGLLHEMFDADLPPYVNYARMGHLIGHELSHVLSMFAMEYGFHGEGNLHWKEDLNEEYVLSHECLIEEYENYALERYGVLLNGTFTLDENIADLVGTHAAYEVFMHFGSRLKLPAIGEHYTARQLFWISFAMYYCDPQETAHVFSPKVVGDEHGIPSFRIFSTLRNSDRFAKDFNCPAGSRMNPGDKCRV